MVCGAHTFMGRPPPPGGPGRAVRRDPGTLIPRGAVTPRHVQADRRRYRDRRRWSFASGVDHGDWVMVEQSRRPATRRGAHAGDARRAAQGGRHVDDTWFSLGMRGTGRRTSSSTARWCPSTGRCGSERRLARHRGRRRSITALSPAGRATLATLLRRLHRRDQRAGSEPSSRRPARASTPIAGEAKVRAPASSGGSPCARAEIAHAWTLAQQNCDLLEEAMRHDPPMPPRHVPRPRWDAPMRPSCAGGRPSGSTPAPGPAPPTTATSAADVPRRVDHHASRHVDSNTTLEMQGKVLLGVEQVDALI